MRSAALRLNAGDARHLLGAYHFAPRPLRAALEHLGTIQYDPLKPLGRNPDLVLQARVTGYAEHDWERAAYRRRRIYDAWDKQACLALVEDWPYRRLYHRHFRRRWGERVLDRYPDEVRATLDALERRGPLSSLDFGDDPRPRHLRGSWYGDKLVKHILRGLWLSGAVVTHHRDKGRHVYDLPERVLPSALVAAPDPGEEPSLRYLLRRRVQAAGLLRPNADAALWSLPLPSGERRALLDTMVRDGELRAVEVDGQAFLAVPGALAALDAPLPRGMRFVAPLDGLLWDRRAVAQLYGFDYVWEVYKPEAQRRWGYYVLPVWHRGALVGRFDARREQDGRLLRVLSFHWERPPRATVRGALRGAMRRFARYLGVSAVMAAEAIDAPTRRALLEGAPS